MRVTGFDCSRPSVMPWAASGSSIPVRSWTLPRRPCTPRSRTSTSTRERHSFFAMYMASPTSSNRWAATETTSLSFSTLTIETNSPSILDHSTCWCRYTQVSSLSTAPHISGWAAHCLLGQATAMRRWHRLTADINSPAWCFHVPALTRCRRIASTPTWFRRSPSTLHPTHSTTEDEGSHTQSHRSPTSFKEPSSRANQHAEVSTCERG